MKADAVASAGCGFLHIFQVQLELDYQRAGFVRSPLATDKDGPAFKQDLD